MNFFCIHGSESTNAIEIVSGCGSVGIAVASNSRGPWFESSHRQKIIINIYSQLYWKDENKEKETENGPFLKKMLLTFILGRTPHEE